MVWWGAFRINTCGMDGKKQDGGRGRLSCDVIPVEALVQPRGSSVAEMTHCSHPRWGREDWVFILQVGLLSCVHAQSLSHVRLFSTQWTVAYQAPLSMGFSRKEYWSGLPCHAISFSPPLLGEGSLRKGGTVEDCLSEAPPAARNNFFILRGLWSAQPSFLDDTWG